MGFGKDGLPDDVMPELPEIAASISAAERRAMAAERETVDRLIAHFLADRIGAEFEGSITGVTRSGLFVRLNETGADGFIPAGTLGADYFRYEEPQHALIGDRTGETHRLGDPATVRLVEAVPLAGALAVRTSVGRRHDASWSAFKCRPARRPDRREEVVRAKTGQRKAGTRRRVGARKSPADHQEAKHHEHVHD